MQVHDLTAGGKTGLTDLMEAHYRQFWCSAPDRRAELAPDVIRSRVGAIRQRLPGLARAFARVGVPLDGVSLILFVGCNASNGHAVRTPQGFAAWLALECFATVASIDAFLTHELAHAAHYTRVPELYFESVGQQRTTGRQLITEAIATRLAMLTGNLDEGTALWGDHLEPQPLDRWLRRCHELRVRLARQVLEHWEEPLPGNPLFTHSIGADVDKDRGGYFTAVRAVIALEQRGLSIAQLARSPRPEIEAWFIDALRYSFDISGNQHSNA